MITCTFEHGGEGSLRHLTVACIVINTDKQILLVKRAPNLPNGNKYTVPGGFLDRDETIQEGALRELQEESGLIGEDVLLFRINDSPNRPKEDRQNVDFIFIVKKFTGELQTNKEVTELQWFDEADLPADESFAFDHRESILRYFEYEENPFPLPLIG